MKKIILIAAGLLTLTIAPAFSQGLPTRFAGRLVLQNENSTNSLTKFNLDFPGGPPSELVKAIEKATGKPLNVIISDEDNGAVNLPALKLNNVDVVQLFDALQLASVKPVQVRNSPNSFTYSTFESYYGFTTKGQPSDDSIWYFTYDKPAVSPEPAQTKVIHFYSMERFLNRGLTVDDITTAIQTGWKMAGIKPAPEMNYHKETKMLIVYAEPDKLVSLEAALSALPTASTDYNLQEMSETIKMLRTQIQKLNAKFPSANSNSPEEKSGK